MLRAWASTFRPWQLPQRANLQAKTGLDATFVEGNVYDARALIEGYFDRVYVTWGAINWLPDIGRWAKVVSSLLKPGGSLYLLEGHPFIMILDETTPEMRPRYDWRTPQDKPVIMDTELTYTGDTAKIAHTTTRRMDSPAERHHQWLDRGGTAPRLAS